jgi:large subunit ribosomal protein LP0
LEPSKTSFFQALNIATKINKGQIEINNDVHLIKKGEKVGTSEATLLQMLNIKPFQYGLVIKKIYDNGIIYDDFVLDITDEDILSRFRKGIANVTCLSLGISFPTAVAVPHVLANGFRNVLAIAMATNLTFKQAERFKDLARSPVQVVSSQPTAVETTTTTTSTKAPEPEESKEKEKEKEPEEDISGLGDLFG